KVAEDHPVEIALASLFCSCPGLAMGTAENSEPGQGALRPQRQSSATMSDSPQLPAVPEVRCPCCLILMRVVAVQNTPEQRLTLPYHCDRCGADSKRSFFKPSRRLSSAPAA